MAAEERIGEMSKSKVWIDQNAGTAQGGRVEPNKENKEIVQSERLAPWKAYAAWIAASEAAGALSGWLSRSGMEFYKAAVLKPPLSPPSIVFPIAWTVLYGLMGIGAARVYLGADSRERSRGLRLFWLQLGFNFCWSPVFFNLRWYGFALIWLAVLWGLILRMALEFGKTDRKAAWMQAPYLLWTAFALYLNLGVLLLNGR